MTPPYYLYARLVAIEDLSLLVGEVTSLVMVLSDFESEEEEDPKEDLKETSCGYSSGGFA